MAENKAQLAKQELQLRAGARKHLKIFLMLRWARYKQSEFLTNWHIDYLCKILEATTPFNNNPNIITRLMFNMPPSYGKTDIIARTFIAWALGNDRRRKFIYISYSDELCKKISNEVRDLIKSKFWESIFQKPAVFLQDNVNEFILKEGGGLFVTTLKSAITGFHAHQILIDDPIKVADIASRAERNKVNQNYKESVLSRLQNNQSNITILMQRLHDDDLCGYLLNPKNFDEDTIKQWRHESLKAIEKEDKVYEIGSFRYERKALEPLFQKRHNVQQLKALELQMGVDEFSTQYLQEPMTREAGFFEIEYFKTIPAYEVGNTNDYIFVDNAISTNAKADNRAIVCIGLEAVGNNVRYVVKDCVFGIWDESLTTQNLIEMMSKFKNAKVFIESDGAGIVLKRLLDKELVNANESIKKKGGQIITNIVQVYTASRKISKVEKIKALKPYYNTGALAFVNSARGLEQIKRELLSFNPEKPFRKDDCIDCIASCLISSDVCAPAVTKPTAQLPKWIQETYTQTSWRI